MELALLAWFAATGAVLACAGLAAYVGYRRKALRPIGPVTPARLFLYTDTLGRQSTAIPDPAVSSEKDLSSGPLDAATTTAAPLHPPGRDSLHHGVKSPSSDGAMVFTVDNALPDDDTLIISPLAPDAPEEPPSAFFPLVTPEPLAPPPEDLLQPITVAFPFQAENPVDDGPVDVPADVWQELALDASDDQGERLPSEDVVTLLAEDLKAIEVDAFIQLERLRRENEELREEINVSRTTVVSIRETLLKRSVSLDAAVARAATTEDAAARAALLKPEIERLAAENRELEVKLEETQAKASFTRDDLGRARVDFETAIERLMVENRELERKWEEARSRASSIHDDLERSRTDLEAETARRLQAESARPLVFSELNGLRQENAALLERIRESDQMIASLKRDIENQQALLQSELERVENEKQEAIREARDSAGRLNEKNQELLLERARAAESLDVSASDLADARSRNEALFAQARESEALIDGMRSRVESLEGEVRERTQSLRPIEEADAQRREALSARDEALRLLEMTSQEEARGRAEAETAVREASAKIGARTAEAEIRIQGLLHDLDASLARNAQVEEKFRLLAREKDDRETAFAAALAQAADSVREIDHHQETLNGFASQVSFLKERLESVRIGAVNERETLEHVHEKKLQKLQAESLLLQEELTTRSEILEMHILESEGRAKDLQLDTARLALQLSRREKMNEALEKGIQEREMRLSELGGSIESLRAALKTAREHEQTATAEVARQKSVAAQYDRELQHARRQYQEAERVRKIQEQESVSTLGRKESEIAQFKGNIEELTLKLDYYKKSLEQAELERLEIRERLKETFERLRSQEDKHLAAIESLESLGAERASLLTEHGAIKEKFAALDSQHRAFRARVQASEKEKAALAEEVQVLRKKDAEGDAARRRADELTRETEALTAKTRDLEGKFAAAMRDRQVMAKDRDSLALQGQELAKARDTALRAAQQLARERSDLKTEVAALQEKQTLQAGDREGLVRDKEKLAASHAQLASVHEQLKRRYGGLEESLRAVVLEKEEMARELAETNDALTFKDVEIQQLRTAAADARELIAETAASREQIAALQNQLRAGEDKILSLKHEMVTELEAAPLGVAGQGPNLVDAQRKLDAQAAEVKRLSSLVARFKGEKEELLTRLIETKKELAAQRSAGARPAAAAAPAGVLTEVRTTARRTIRPRSRPPAVWIAAALLGIATLFMGLRWILPRNGNSPPPARASARPLEATVSSPLQSYGDTLTFIDQWARSYEDPAPSGFMGLYTDAFRKSAGKPWEETVRRQFEAPGDRRVDIQDLRITPAPTGIEARFLQKTTSGDSLQVGRKRLFLVREAGGLRIADETWTPLESAPAGP